MRGGAVPIRPLSAEVTAQIAAGEVVERPASVVKELVENALDAGATRIDVEVAEGGRQLIRVSDDGRGIPADELPLAFARHATSKLSHLRDLDALQTLGFRGEALASIAAVSHTELCSRTAVSTRAVEVVMDAGAEVRQGPAARAPGTTVSVRGLFRPTPARFKFLRSTQAEAARIHAVVAAYALAAPQVRFQLRFDARDVLASPGDGELASAVRAIYRDDADNMLPVAGAGRNGVMLDGLVGAPTLSRATREHFWLFVNGRWIVHRGVNAAIEGAYRTLLQVGRHPVAVIRLTVPPETVDVNVHPTKAEVRFLRDRDICSAVYTAVQEVLLASPVVPEAEYRQDPPPWPAWNASPLSGPLAQPPRPEPTSEGFDGGYPGRAAAVAGTDGTSASGPASGGAVSPFTPPRQAPFPRMPVLRVLGQVDESYIISEGPQGVYLIDQHAAHERILFDRLRAAAQEGVSPQILLEPAPLHLTPGQVAAYQAQAGLFAQLGFQLEPFGGDSLLLRGVPPTLAGRNPVRALLDVLDEMGEEHRGGTTYGEAALWAVACRSAIKAGQQLSTDEMVELVRQLEATSSPQTCAHGRPTMIHLSVSQLERQFGRR
ncbi:MAG TPA: DNA mismatch repair endonuclease MutL [Chloroflexota bacterium]|nr:DNA mismatch repair endonuclease MutL [Chloroflexota bacterium]